MEEAVSQHEASKLLNPAIIGVPKIYDYFVDGDCGYLTMEFIDGHIPREADYVHIVPRLAESLRHLHTFTRGTPGPFPRSASRGPIWTGDPVEFASTELLETYLNSRLGSIDEKFDLAKSDMVLCHLDLAPRNVLLTGQTVWLLDWEAAGFYPRGFEYCALRMNRGQNEEDGMFTEMLEKCLVALERPSPQDLAQASLMQAVASNNLRCSFTKGRIKKKRKLDSEAMEREQRTLA